MCVGVCVCVHRLTHALLGRAEILKRRVQLMCRSFLALSAEIPQLQLREEMYVKMRNCSLHLFSPLDRDCSASAM